MLALGRSTTAAATWVYRLKVLSFALEVAREVDMPPGHFLFVAQVLVVAATAELYMCVNLRDNPLERFCSSAVRLCELSKGQSDACASPCLSEASGTHRNK